MSSNAVYNSHPQDYTKIYNPLPLYNIKMLMLLRDKAKKKWKNRELLGY